MKTAKKETTDLGRKMTETGASADRMRQRMEAATKALPKIEIDADSTPAEIKFAQLRADLEKLSSKKIGIDIDSDAARAQLAEIERELENLQRNEANIDVKADIGTALAELRAVDAEVSRLNGANARVSVDANVGGALANIALVAAALASLPAVATIGVGVAGLGAAFGAAGAGAAAFGAVAIPTMGRVSAAVDEMGKATGSAGGAVKSAGQAAAEAAQKALQLEQAERKVVDAKRAARDAEVELTRAREDARRAIQDLNLSLKDAVLSEKDAALSIEEAQERLNEVMSDPEATDLQRRRAQLSYDQAVQNLEDQRVRTKRLASDTAEANRKGVEGSDQVRQARQREAEADRAVIRAQKELRILRLQQAAALQQAGGAAGGAASKFDQLSKKEQQMAKDLKKYKDAYVEWQQSLQGDVFPAIKGGLDLVEAQLPRISPLVKTAAGSFVDFERDATTALNAPIFEKLLWDLNTHIPGAIDGLGASFLNVTTGFAGILDAFLPFTPTIVGGLEEATRKFADWGTQLQNDPAFHEFIAYVRENAPEVWQLIKDIASAGGDIVTALAPLGGNALAGLALLAKITAGMSPGQLQAVALAIGAIYAATKIGGGISSAIDLWGTLRGKLDDVGNSAKTTKSRLSGLASGVGAVGGVLAFSAALGAVDQHLNGVQSNLPKTAKELEDFARTGKLAGSLAEQWGDSLGTVVEDVESWDEALGRAGGNTESFREAISRLADPGPMESFKTNTLSVLSAVTLGFRDFDDSSQKLTGMDKALASLVSAGKTDQAAAAFRRFEAEAAKAGVKLEKLRELFPEYTAAVAAAEGPTSDTAAAIGDANTKVNDFSTSLGLFSQRTDVTAALQALKKDYDDVKRAVDEAGGKLDFSARMTDRQRDAVVKAREQFGGYISKVADAAQKQADLAKKTGDAAGAADRAKEAVLRQLDGLFELAGNSKDAREQVFKLAENFGISREQAIKAAKSVQGLREEIAKLKDKKVHIEIVTTTKERLLEKDKRLGAADGGIFLRDGGLVDVPGRTVRHLADAHHYAAGGVTHAGSTMPYVESFAGGTERHIAQIAPAGAWRVWAEPETGGEAYIPLAGSKRVRSTKILGAVAGEFGYALVPADRMRVSSVIPSAGAMLPPAGGVAGGVMAGSAARSLPIGGTGSGGTSQRRTSRPVMGNAAAYGGVPYSQAAQSGSLAGRLAREAAGRSGPLVAFNNAVIHDNVDMNLFAEKVVNRVNARG